MVATAGKYSTASIYTAGTHGKAGTCSIPDIIIIYTVRVVIFKGFNFHCLTI